MLRASNRQALSDTPVAAGAEVDSVTHEAGCPAIGLAIVAGRIGRSTYQQTPDGLLLHPGVSVIVAMQDSAPAIAIRSQHVPRGTQDEHVKLSLQRASHLDHMYRHTATCPGQKHEPSEVASSHGGLSMIQCLT